jgi:hypothetical protein
MMRLALKAGASLGTVRNWYLGKNTHETTRRRLVAAAVALDVPLPAAAP